MRADQRTPRRLVGGASRSFVSCHALSVFASHTGTLSRNVAANPLERFVPWLARDDAQPSLEHPGHCLLDVSAAFDRSIWEEGSGNARAGLRPSRAIAFLARRVVLLR